MQFFIYFSTKCVSINYDDEDNQKFYELRKTKDFNKLYNKWISLIDNIKDYYKLKLESEFVKNGETVVRKLHK